ncbi:MAG: DegT/DnrJ/EryC1/StrS family aminotransferase [Planctomycetota bacterium]
MSAPPWRVPLSRPDITEEERQAVLEVLRTPILSLGEEGSLLEAEFENLLGVPSALVSSGTAGLYLALRALGVDGGEVITPSFGFVGTVHAIRLAGARPRFADIDPVTLCVSAETIEPIIGDDTRAILPVHIFGTPCPMAEILELARARALPVIEDACEALGSLSGGHPAGTLGHAGVFAFYPNKQMTTGEGGLVVAPSPELVAIVRSMRNQGRGEGEFEFVREGFNFRMTEMQAALGRAQLRRLGVLLAEREKRARRYQEALEGLPGLTTLPPPLDGDQRSWFVFPVFVADPRWRAPLRDALRREGIQTALYFPPIHGFGVHGGPAPATGELPVTEAVAARSFAIPFHSRIGAAEQDLVAETLRQALASVAGRGAAPFSLQTLAPERA